MWFHTAPFRNLILNYKPEHEINGQQDHDESIEATIHQMRVLFAQMLLTKKRYFNKAHNCSEMKCAC